MEKFDMPSNPKKGKTLKCTENLKDFYENEDEFKFPEGKCFTRHSYFCWKQMSFSLS